jgi:hypothetical protein
MNKTELIDKLTSVIYDAPKEMDGAASSHAQAAR